MSILVPRLTIQGGRWERKEIILGRLESNFTSAWIRQCESLLNILFILSEAP
jgi:hypothetical protein